MQVRRFRHSSAQYILIGMAVAVCVVPCSLLSGMQTPDGGLPDPIEFNRDIRPILSESCWQCHGPDAHARKSGLRLDDAASATAASDSGVVAIVPGQPEASELTRRITSEDPAIQMPPVDSGRTLSTRQKELLQQWILEGASYQAHWAFLPPVKRAIPADATAGSTEVRHAIDAFVGAALHEHGLSFSAEAPAETLVRRVFFDLTGLPPTTAELNQALAEGYEATVDRLLASPHYGERMAAEWLDAARYADTNGYFSDKPRTMWLWRDWVIDAFNRNMPFDQFTVEQLAGDLLPASTIPQKIATGFNRNHPANNETGIIDEEFRTAYVIDRVDTTMTTWTGLTVGCAQCHDHKYDPISQKEFYQLYAFFNQGPETGLIVSDNPPPVITVTTPEQDAELTRLTERAARAADEFEKIRPELENRLAAWQPDALQSLPALPIDDDALSEPFDAGQAAARAFGTGVDYETGVAGTAVRFDGTQHLEFPSDITWNPDEDWSVGFWMLPDSPPGCPVAQIEPEGRRRGWEVLCHKGRITVNLVSEWGVEALELVTAKPLDRGTWHHVIVARTGPVSPDGITIFVDGRAAEVQVRRDTFRGSLLNSEPVRIARRDEGLGYYGLLDEIRILQRGITSHQALDWFRSERLRGILERPGSSRSTADGTFLIDEFLALHGTDSERAIRKHMQESRAAESEFRAAFPTALVMEDLSTQRETRILQRGQYDVPGEIVEPDTPAILGRLPPGEPRNRLGLAHWLVSPDHPLTARVTVNRLWQQCFGIGLVRTADDFGSQGQAPDHAALLDWLAVSFRESGWDLKAMLRQIVLSRTYRQSSARDPSDNASDDPSNRWFARGPRFRLSAEMIRDQALAASGLLVRTVGGPSVKPWQPEGLWEEVSYNGEDSYVQDSGDNLFRRSLYTFLKRQAPPPALLMFDATTREQCTVARARTNTPLQALVLLNDPVFLQAARTMVASREGTNEQQQLAALFRRILIRAPSIEETRTLQDLLHRQRVWFLQHPDQAMRMVSSSEETPEPANGAEADTRDARDIPTTAATAELAAWTVTAHSILNLDEAVMRP